jgi:hypothetical protein
METNLLTLDTVSATDPINGAMSVAAALESRAKALSSLSMHSQRLSRQFERTLTLLRDLQKARHAQEEQERNNLLDIMEAHESKGETYNPSDHGFVFSKSEIAAAMLARKRERLASAFWRSLRAAA